MFLDRFAIGLMELVACAGRHSHFLGPLAPFSARLGTTLPSLESRAPFCNTLGGLFDKVRKIPKARHGGLLCDVISNRNNIEDAIRSII